MAMGRSFNLRDCAVEIFLKEGKSYFFNLYSNKEQVTNDNNYYIINIDKC